MDEKKKETLQHSLKQSHLITQHQVVDSVSIQFDRKNYVDPKKMQQAKEAAYTKDGKLMKTTKDPISGKTLHRDGAAAVRKVGLRKATTAKSNTDHVIPLKEIHSVAKYNAFLSDEDIKAIANREANLSEISQHTNQSKGGDSYRTYIKKHPELSESEKAAMLRAHRKAATDGHLKMAQNTAKNVTATAVQGAKDALISAAPTLINQAVKDIKSVRSGEMSTGEAVKDFAKTAGVVVGSGAGVAVVSKGGAQIINAVASDLKLSVEVTPAQLGAVVTGCVAVYNAIQKLSDPNMDTGEALIQIAEDTLCMVISNLGYGIGSVFGPVGGMICSAILSYACNTVVQMGREYRASKKFLEQSEKFLAYARERSEQFRRELAQYAAATMETYERVMNDTLQSISQCIEHQDPDILFAGINKAGAVFGVRYQFQSFEEFDEFMSDEDNVFVF